MWTFHLIEFSVLAMFVAAAVHGYRAGPDKFLTLTGAAIFGLIIEFFFVTVFAGYSYGEFLLAPTLNGESVPIWVGLGWGTIIYTSMVASDRMGLPWAARPAADALLAVSIDIALDPMAEALGWWSWSREGQFYGVPADNFIGWLEIVGIYSLTIRAGFKLLGRSGAKMLAVPILALIGSAAAVAGLQFVLEEVYKITGEPLLFFMVVLLLMCLIAAAWGIREAKKPDGLQLFIPLCMHGILLGTLVSTGVSDALPSLLVLMPVVAIGSLLGFMASSKSTW